MRADCRVVSLNRACCYDSRVSVVCGLSLAECMGEENKRSFDLLSHVASRIPPSLPSLDSLDYS